METLHELEDNLLLFFTGITRSASSILSDQNIKTKVNDREMLENLDIIKDLGYQSRDALITGNTLKFGELMHTHWQHKQLRSKDITNEFIDMAYSKALTNGAVGGKLVGAGGGGFFDVLLFRKRESEKSNDGIGFRRGAI